MGLFRKDPPSEEYMQEYNRELKEQRSAKDRKKAREDARRSASGGSGFMGALVGIGRGIVKVDKAFAPQGGRVSRDPFASMFGGAPSGRHFKGDPIANAFGYGSGPERHRHHHKKHISHKSGHGKHKSVRIIFDD